MAAIHNVDMRGDTLTTSFMMADIDADGILESIQFNSDKILGRDAERGMMNICFEIGIPLGYAVSTEDPNTGVAKDLRDNDGVDEFYFVIGASDHYDWRIIGLNPVDQKIFLNEPLPLFESTRKEPWWDGAYSVAGFLDDADGQGNCGLVLARRVRYDAFPRGLVVVSPFDGHIMWEFRCGGNIAGYAVIVTDLEGDGTQEVLFHTTAPQNLHGRKVNGTSDDFAYFFVISHTGQELYKESMCAGFGNGWIEAADLTGDGSKELITFSDNRGVANNNRLRIMDWQTKEVLGQKITPYPFLGCAIVDGPVQGTHWIVTGSNKGTLNRFLFDGKTLVSDHSLFYGVGKLKNVQVLGAVDVVSQHPGQEILVDIDNGHYTVLMDRELKTLAVYVDPNPASRNLFSSWEAEGINPLLVCGGQSSEKVFEVYPQNLSLLARFNRFGVPVLLAAAFVGIFFLGKIRGKREQEAKEIAVLPARNQLSNDRAALYRLWQELDDVKHENLLDASKGLRRLVWLLDAYASEIGGTTPLEERIRKLRYDFLESVYPRLRDILHLAEKENFEPDTILGTRTALTCLARSLEELLDHEELTQENVAKAREAMNADLQVIESGLLKIWNALKQYFTTDPVRMLQGLLVVREVEFQRAGIQSELVGETDPQVVSCIIDSGDIRYVLDNLVDNAVRAMKDCPERLLRINVLRNNGELALEVSDTGCGIESQVQGRIFNGRFSSRTGGGMGLVRSVDILEKWLGEISLTDSTVGKGTTFVVKLRAAQKLTESQSLDAMG